MSIATEILRLQTAKANLKTAIEGKGVTVQSDTTLDGYASLVSSISGGGGTGATYGTGTFTGSGSSASEQLNIGFEPDVVIVAGEMEMTETGWRGTGHIIIVKNVLVAAFVHTSDTATAAGIYADDIRTGEDSYGASSSKAYVPFGSYSNGVFTVDNKTPNANTYFVNNKQYTWYAYKNPIST